MEITICFNKQWIGARENLQETIDFPIRYIYICGFTVIFPGINMPFCLGKTPDFIDLSAGFIRLKPGVNEPGMAGEVRRVLLRVSNVYRMLDQ